MALSDFPGRSAFRAGQASAAASLLNVFLCRAARSLRAAQYLSSLCFRLTCQQENCFKKCIFFLPCPVLTTQPSQTHLFSVLYLSPSHVGQAGTEGWGRRDGQGRQTPASVRAHRERQPQVSASAMRKSQGGGRRASGVCTSLVLKPPTSQDPPGQVRSPLSVFSSSLFRPSHSTVLQGFVESCMVSCLGNTLGILWRIPFRSPESRFPVAQLSYSTFNTLPRRLSNFLEVCILHFRERLWSHLLGIPGTL